MKSHEVDVDILLECEEGDPATASAMPRARSISLGARPMLPTASSMPEISYLKSVTRLRVKTLDLMEFCVYAGIEVLFGHGRIILGEHATSGVGGRRGGQRHLAGVGVDPIRRDEIFVVIVMTVIDFDSIIVGLEAVGGGEVEGGGSSD